jgi:hypothetical protein
MAVVLRCSHCFLRDEKWRCCMLVDFFARSRVGDILCCGRYTRERENERLRDDCRRLQEQVISLMEAQKETNARLQEVLASQKQMGARAIVPTDSESGAGCEAAKYAFNIIGITLKGVGGLVGIYVGGVPGAIILGATALVSMVP